MLERVTSLTSTDKTTARSENGLDEGRMVRVITARFAQIHDALQRRVVGDGRALPNVLDQLSFGDQTMTLVEQELKNSDRLFPMRLFRHAASDAALHRLYLYLFNAVNRLGREDHHPPCNRWQRDFRRIPEKFRLLFVTLVCAG